MRQVRLQQGDSFTMNFIIKDNGVPSYISQDEDIAVGFYNEYGPKYIAKLGEDTIKKDDHVEGKYSASVSSEVTKNFVGNVDVEIVVYNTEDESKVAHADKVINMYFEERRINSDI